MGLIEHPCPTVLSVENNSDQTRGLPFPSEESKSMSEIQRSTRDPLVIRGVNQLRGEETRKSSLRSWLLVPALLLWAVA
jgi:hypothetical protein